MSSRSGGPGWRPAIPANVHLDQRPVVAIVGRPNVGKSTLFNRLAGTRLAIVEDIPGVTRDRHYADATSFGRPYVLIDTGGFDPHSDDPMKSGIAHHVRLALDECDLVICVLDASAQSTPADQEAVRLLRQSQKPVIFTANKAESQQRQINATQHYELGIDHLIPISALHGRGVGDLEEAISEALPERVENPADDHDFESSIPRVAIVGRPNAGKSSLMNHILGQERLLVDDRAGTTVDSIDMLVESQGGPMVMIDTAGIRRKRSVKGGIEGLSVIHSIRSMERSDVVVVLIDAEMGVAEQDAKIAGLAHDRGRAMVIGLNKGDLLDREARRKAITRTEEILAFAPWAEIIPLSAKTGRGVNKLMEAIRRAVNSHRQRIGTGPINRFFEEVLTNHPPPTYRKRPVRLYYVTQAQIKPPTFIAVTNEPEGIHFSYQRYVVNQIRQRFGFGGTPIRVRYRSRRKEDQE